MLPIPSPAPPVSTSAFDSLPTELVLSVLTSLSLVDVLSLSSTCRALRARLMSPLILSRVLVLPANGDLRWVAPVRQLPQESERACASARLWLAMADNAPCTSSSQASPSLGEGEDAAFAAVLSHPLFPIVPFLRACWASDSMRNRRRLWRMVKQFDGLWEEYRTRGPRVPRFFPSEEVLELLQEEEQEFRPVCER